MTADREPEPISRTGSSISVIKGETLATSNPGSLVDALRTVPGLDVSESGGPGSTTNVRLRGANTGQTLVLIDGVRVRSLRRPAATSTSRCSRRALSSGSRCSADRKARSRDRTPSAASSTSSPGKAAVPRNSTLQRRRQLRHLARNGSVLGSKGPWSYAVTGALQHSTGSPALAIASRRSRPASGPLEPDGLKVIGGSARVGFDAGEGVRFDTGTLSSSPARTLTYRPAFFPTRHRARRGWFGRPGDAPRSIRLWAYSPTTSTSSTPNDR